MFDQVCPSSADVYNPLLVEAAITPEPEGSKRMRVIAAAQRLGADTMPVFDGANVAPPSLLKSIPPFGGGCDIPTRTLSELVGSTAKAVGAPQFAHPRFAVVQVFPPSWVMASCPFCCPTKIVLLLEGSTETMTGVVIGHDCSANFAPKVVLLKIPSTPTA